MIFQSFRRAAEKTFQLRMPYLAEQGRKDKNDRGVSSSKAC